MNIMLMPVILNKGVKRPLSKNLIKQASFP